MEIRRRHLIKAIDLVAPEEKVGLEIRGHDMDVAREGAGTSSNS
jgi:hypothetical protein